jgi:hypothetical protein
VASQGIHVLDEIGSCAISHGSRLMMRAGGRRHTGPSLKGD